MEYRISVQCDDAISGKTGTFLSSIGDRLPNGLSQRNAISPVFPSLAELYPWMRENGWKSDEYVDKVFIPWRVIAVNQILPNK